MNARLGLLRAVGQRCCRCKYKEQVGLDIGKSIRGLQQANPAFLDKGILNQAVLFERLGKV